MNAATHPADFPHLHPVMLSETSGPEQRVELPSDWDVIVLPLVGTPLGAFPGVATAEAGIGSLLLVPSNTCNSVEFADNHKALILLACPTLRQMVNAERGQARGAVPGTVTLLQAQPQIAAMLSLIRRLMLVDEAEARYELQLLVKLMLIEVARSSARRMQGLPVIGRQKLTRRQVTAIDRYIDRNLEASLQLADLAQVVGMSRYHFLRCFKRATGFSPLQYVLTRRLERARELLASGAGGIAEVAYATGFSSQSHLNAMFKRQFGVTPGRYRRSSRQAAVALTPARATGAGFSVPATSSH